MSQVPHPHRVRDPITAYFWSDDTIRSRQVSGTVPTGKLDIPVPPARLRADWEREISVHLGLEPGDVEALPLLRTRARWPAYSHCVQTMSAWTGALGLPGVLAASEVALMVCRGARYHHDGAQYGGKAFCNLFLSEECGLDLHFPAIDVRIPLGRGTAVIFDTGQPHGVIRRGGSGFDAAGFTPACDYTQVFLSWELAIENAQVARTLGVAFDTAAPGVLQADTAQLMRHGVRAEVCPQSGRWRQSD
jgi:hypothetical protein